jgi:hypothetical protein
MVNLNLTEDFTNFIIQFKILSEQDPTFDFLPQFQGQFFTNYCSKPLYLLNSLLALHHYSNDLMVNLLLSLTKLLILVPLYLTLIVFHLLAFGTYLFLKEQLSLFQDYSVVQLGKQSSLVKSAK